jgi:hypothetical protein
MEAIRFVAGQTVDALAQVCEAVNKATPYRLRWRRASASDASGVEREAGQWDARNIDAAWLASGNKAGDLYLWFILQGMDAKTGRRKVRISSSLALQPAPAPTSV